MARQKYYAVKKGRETGIFRDEAAYKRSTNGFSGYEAKVFKTLEQAVAYMGDRAPKTAAKKPKPNTTSPKEKQSAQPPLELPAAYTDGSFCNGRYGYGVLLLEHAPDGALRAVEIGGYGDNSGILPSRNISGELLAVLKAVEYAAVRGYPRLYVYHDLLQAASWVQTPGCCRVSHWYHREFQRLAHGMAVVFHKVLAHSGDPHNAP